MQQQHPHQQHAWAHPSFHQQAQLGALAQKTIELRNQGASLKRLLDDVDRGELRERLTPRELALVKEVMRLSFEGALSPMEVVEACQQGGAIVPSR